MFAIAEGGAILTFPKQLNECFNKKLGILFDRAKVLGAQSLLLFYNRFHRASIHIILCSQLINPKNKVSARLLLSSLNNCTCLGARLE